MSRDGISAAVPSPNFFPVVLAGGAGTRLWPLSRRKFPKQFLAPTGDRSFFGGTLARVANVPGFRRFILVTNEEYRFLVAEETRGLGHDASIIIEPVGRNTAPAIALAAHAALEDDADAVLLVLPSDQVVKNDAAFLAAVGALWGQVRAGRLATFGIVPDRPETGYGYIRRGAPVDEVHRIAEFVEKPDFDRASLYVAGGEHYWNSGMFMFRADAYLAELQRSAVDIASAAAAAWRGRSRDLDFIRPDRDAFVACRSESIDYAVMEHTQHGVVAPLDAGWSDIGSWTALADFVGRDQHGNALHGDVFAFDTQDAVIHADSRLVATLGVEGLVVIETADAVLVASRDRVQDVKHIVSNLVAAGRPEATEHRKNFRPWGFYESVLEGHHFQVKKLFVKPGGKLSLQMHHHRAEHWVVVKGTAKVTNGGREFLLAENESTYIPKGCTHRLENPGKIELEVVEIQTGAYLGEDDIVRFEDSYGR